MIGLVPKRSLTAWLLGGDGSNEDEAEGGAESEDL